MFFAFFAMHLKWLCIVFALLSTLRLSEGQTFEGVDGRAYGIMYSDTADTLVGSVTGVTTAGETCSSLTTANYVTYAETTSNTDNCFVLSASQPYTGGNANSEEQTATTTNFVVYLAPATITDATATSAIAAGAATGVTLNSLTDLTAPFYYDCGTALNAIDTTNAAYFTFTAVTGNAVAPINWKKALAEDPILFLGTIRCLFSHQAATPNDYATVSTASYRVVADFTITPPLAADATITCSLNPTAADAVVGTVVGTYAYGGDTALTGCTATTSTTSGTSPTLLALHNEDNCYGVVTVAATLTAGEDVTLTVADDAATAIKGSCIMAVPAAVAVADPTCSDAVSAQVDLTYWRASPPATANANVLVDKAIATSPGRALTYSIASSTTNADHYTFEQNTLQVTAAAAATKADGVYTIMVDAVDTDDSSKNAACEVSLTVGAQICVP